MTKSQEPPHWMRYADVETGPLALHLRQLAARRRAAARAIADTGDATSLTPLAAIAVVTLLMFWAVIDPLV